MIKQAAPLPPKAESKEMADLKQNPSRSAVFDQTCQI